MAVAVAAVFASTLFYFSAGNATTSSSSSSSSGKRNNKSTERALVPPHLFSWIPYVGSATELQKQGRHLRDFIRNTSERLDSPVFTATIMGDHCLFLNDPGYIQVMFRDVPNTIDTLTFQKRFMRNVLGFTAHETNVIFDRLNHKFVGKPVMGLLPR